jgi:hypothetical protein
MRARLLVNVPRADIVTDRSGSKAEVPVIFRATGCMRPKVVIHYPILGGK